jgi:hypothetical protein
LGPAQNRKVLSPSLSSSAKAPTKKQVLGYRRAAGDHPEAPLSHVTRETKKGAVALVKIYVP